MTRIKIQEAFTKDNFNMVRRMEVVRKFIRIRKLIMDSLKIISSMAKDS